MSSLEAKPIVFSQTELARRSMEPTPSVELVDVHCPEGAVHKVKLKKIAAEARSSFQGIVDLATQARALRLEVDNEQEGLEATQVKYLELVGDEETAKSLGRLGTHRELALRGGATPHGVGAGVPNPGRPCVTWGSFVGVRIGGC